MNIISIQHVHPAWRAALWMAGALFSFSAMAVGGRELAAELSTFQILFFRSLIGLPLVGLVVMRYGGPQQLRTRRLPLHLLRNLAHFGGQYGWFYGLAFISLAEVFAIEFTVPLWTALLAVVVLGERLTPIRLLAVILGIAGTFIILRPGSGMIHPAALAVLLAAFGYATAHTLTRKLVSTETPLAILFYMTLIQLPLGLIPALTDWTLPSPARWPWVIVVGVSALTAHYCMARALRLADATVVVPLDFLRLPLIALIGALFYGETVTWSLALGSILILSGIATNLWGEQRRQE
ncbi:DMT family transporter [Chloroflexus sp.]|uniref:DMT family transporter n=1 Tax=Chloroflexus sp. TaxID=1904827 RepID=UPI002580DC1C|nr:DMT family transporter [Chloroflexus sp.]